MQPHADKLDDAEPEGNRRWRANGLRIHRIQYRPRGSTT
jgi:hypothetical protein